MKDYEEVQSLWERTEGVGLNESDEKANVEAYLQRNSGMSFVARQGATVVGAVLCGHDGRRGYLHHLAVDGKHRGRGVGKQLVESCGKQLKKAGIMKCNIFVYADNSGGESFWAKNGWTSRDDLRLLQKTL